MRPPRAPPQHPPTHPPDSCPITMGCSTTKWAMRPCTHTHVRTPRGSSRGGAVRCVEGGGGHHPSPACAPAHPAHKHTHPLPVVHVAAADAHRLHLQPHVSGGWLLTCAGGWVGGWVGGVGGCGGCKARAGSPPPTLPPRARVHEERRHLTSDTPPRPTHPPGRSQCCTRRSRVPNSTAATLLRTRGITTLDRGGGTPSSPPCRHRGCRPAPAGTKKTAGWGGVGASVPATPLTRTSASASPTPSTPSPPAPPVPHPHTMAARHALLAALPLLFAVGAFADTWTVNEYFPGGVSSIPDKARGQGGCVARQRARSAPPPPRSRGPGPTLARARPGAASGSGWPPSARGGGARRAGGAQLGGRRAGSGAAAGAASTHRHRHAPPSVPLSQCTGKIPATEQGIMDFTNNWNSCDGASATNCPNTCNEALNVRGWAWSARAWVPPHTHTHTQAHGLESTHTPCCITHLSLPPTSSHTRRPMVLTAWWLCLCSARPPATWCPRALHTPSMAAPCECGEQKPPGACCPLGGCGGRWVAVGRGPRSTGAGGGGNVELARLPTTCPQAPKAASAAFSRPPPPPPPSPAAAAPTCTDRHQARPERDGSARRGPPTWRPTPVAPQGG